jgi:hypothetical protein
MDAGVRKASANVQPEDSLKLEACLMMLFEGISKSKVLCLRAAHLVAVE